MATGTTLISVEEYLSTDYKPACDYIDGVLHQKPMPTWKHGRIQSRLLVLLDRGFAQFDGAVEITCRIRPGKYLVPDVIVQRRDYVQDPYPTDPVHLCVEVLSPDDRLSEVMAKCEEYHAWGVKTTWIVDPDEKRAWVYTSGHRLSEVPLTGSLTADEISIALQDVFSVLNN